MNNKEMLEIMKNEIESVTLNGVLPKDGTNAEATLNEYLSVKVIEEYGRPVSMEREHPMLVLCHEGFGVCVTLDLNSGSLECEGESIILSPECQDAVLEFYNNSDKEWLKPGPIDVRELELMHDNLMYRESPVEKEELWKVYERTNGLAIMYKAHFLALRLSIEELLSNEQYEQLRQETENKIMLLAPGVMLF